jgi:hypothetical protein
VYHTLVWIPNSGILYQLLKNPGELTKEEKARLILEDWVAYVEEYLGPEGYLLFLDGVARIRR